MKIPTYLLGAAIGYFFLASTALGDGFSEFRIEVQRRIPASWVCSKIRTLEGRTLFDVSSQVNRFSIVITRRKLISQKEWTSRLAKAEKAIDSIINDENPEEAAATAALDGLDLPDARYRGTALSIGRSEPDIWYPEIGADDEKSKELLKTISGLVDLYTKSEHGGAGEPATRAESDSEGADKPQPESEGRSR